MSALAEQVKSAYHLTLSPDYVERCLASRPTLTAADLYKKALCENIKDVNDASVLPFGIASQTSATLPNDVVLQIHTSRDATQPLRPCADATEEVAALNAALQKSNNKRLLRLVLTDGYVEIPAFELTTLGVFKGVPIPGEKLLMRAGTDVKNGALIMTESGTVPIGGEVAQLKTEFLAHRRRMEAGYQISGGLEGAPKFQPIHALASGAAFADRGMPANTSQPYRGGRGGGRGGGDRGGGGRGGARGRGYGVHYNPNDNGAGYGSRPDYQGVPAGGGGGGGGVYHSQHTQHGDGGYRGRARGRGGGGRGRGRGRGRGGQE